MRDTVGSEAQPLTGTVAAGSAGIVGGVPRLDLAHEEDVKAETDMNVVCTRRAWRDGVVDGPGGHHWDPELVGGDVG